MYKSPIEIIYKQAEMKMENDILRAVQSYAINVDKAELIRALRYDREQYEKGYADGAADAVAAKHARWANGFCTNCGEEAITEWDEYGGEHCLSRHCPHCGAQMDKERDDKQ